MCSITRIHTLLSFLRHHFLHCPSPLAHHPNGLYVPEPIYDGREIDRYIRRLSTQTVPGVGRRRRGEGSRKSSKSEFLFTLIRNCPLLTSRRREKEKFVALAGTGYTDFPVYGKRWPSSVSSALFYPFFCRHPASHRRVHSTSHQYTRPTSYSYFARNVQTAAANEELAEEGTKLDLRFNCTSMHKMSPTVCRLPYAVYFSAAFKVTFSSRPQKGSRFGAGHCALANLHISYSV